MERRLPCRTSLWGKQLFFCSVLVYMAGVTGEMSHGHPTLSVSAPHLYYTCPEGATPKLLCNQRGAALYPADVLRHSWFFTPHSDQHCTGRISSHSHRNNSKKAAKLDFGSTDHNFWVVLHNVTIADQGRYCCMVLDYKLDNKHGSIMQKPHSHIILQVTPRRNGSQDCTVWDPTPPGGTVPVALAVAACILALLSLPLILVLVYKQRQNAQSSRRAQELVRMDSEAQGHENPVFLGESPQIKTRTVSQIMARQSSETGRHLLSEPGTPLSPPAHGDVFFPIEDTILESPELVQVWNLFHRCKRWSGDGSATLLLFSLPPKWCCPYELSLNNLCWDCRLHIVWTAGGNGLFFLSKAFFHSQQQLEAKSKLLPASTSVVAWTGFVCDGPSWTNRSLMLEKNPGCWSEYVTGWHVKSDKTAWKAAFTP